MPHGFQVVAQDKDSESGWIQLFNGKDLEAGFQKFAITPLERITATRSGLRMDY